MRNKELIKKGLLLFLSSLLLYYVFLILAYCIPDDLLRKNWTESVNLIASEEKRWAVLSGYSGTKLDTFTDNLMFQRLLNKEGLNPFAASMWIDGYMRYWFGIIIFLRPLLVLIGYGGIRYLNIFLVFGLFAFTFSAMKKQLGAAFATAFLVSLCLIHFWIFPLSLQYTPVYVIMMLAILAIFYLKEKNKLYQANMILLFLMIGSLTNYFDLLTAPLLTFGMPFVTYFILENQESITRPLQNYLISVKTGLAWLGGYAITWIAKWLLASAVLRDNIVKYALNQILVRTGGTEDEVLHISEIVKRLLQTMFPSKVMILLGVIFAVWLVFLAFRHKPLRDLLSLTPLLFIAVLPFGWFFVLQNHNQHHFYFTYRILAISVFAVFSFMILTVKRGSSSKQRVEGQTNNE